MTAEILRGSCPQCGPNKKAYVRGRHLVREEFEVEHGLVWGRTTAYILECCGCETLYFRRDIYFSEWDDPSEEQTDYFPSLEKRKRPGWVDEIEISDRVLGRILKELYIGLNSDLHMMSATGIRTAIDRASELLGVDPALGFDRKLQGLQSSGHISANEAALLNDLVDAGNAAAHRGWRPTDVQLATMMDALEGFLHRSLVVIAESVKTLRGAVPPKPKAMPKPEAMPKLKT